MAASETITIGSREFTARKLTVRDIREVEAQIADYANNHTIIDTIFTDGLPSVVVLRSLGVGIDDLEDLLPEDIKTLMEAVATVNPIYADSLLGRLSAASTLLSSSSTGPAHD